MFSAAVRKASTALVRVPARSLHIEQRGIPGENLPFSIESPLKMTIIFAVFFGSGFAMPFVAVRHQLLKK